MLEATCLFPTKILARLFKQFQQNKSKLTLHKLYFPFVYVTALLFMKYFLTSLYRKSLPPQINKKQSNENKTEQPNPIRRL